MEPTKDLKEDIDSKIKELSKLVENFPHNFQLRARLLERPVADYLGDSLFWSDMAQWLMGISNEFLELSRLQALHYCRTPSLPRPKKSWIKKIISPK